jgi:hypothetical protein
MYSLALSRRSLSVSVRCEQSKGCGNNDKIIQKKIKEVFKTMSDRRQHVEGERLAHLQKMHDAVKDIFNSEIEYLKGAAKENEKENERDPEPETAVPDVLDALEKEESESSSNKKPTEDVFVDKSVKY